MPSKPRITWEAGHWFCTGVCRCGHHTVSELGGNPEHAWNQYQRCRHLCGFSGTHLLPLPDRIVHFTEAGDYRAVSYK